MPSYLYRIGYTSQAWATQVKHPLPRFEAVRPVVEGMGGKITAAYYAFGEDDVIFICDMPDNVSAAAFSIAAAAGGALTHVHTTPLMSVDEGLQAIKKSAASSYKPPS